MRNAKLSWLVFVLLGAAMGFLRYGGKIGASELDIMFQYGPWLMLVVHIVLVLMAFQDSVYDGILSLLIPLYSFYWLFVVSDAFLLRAVVAGLLAGVGQDSLAFYQEHFGTIIRVGKDWIQSGGG